MIRIGFGLLTGQSPTGRPEAYREAIERAVEVERLGFDSVWTAEHHFVGDGHVPSPLVLLAAMAARTRSITLGTCVLLAPLYNPIRLAEDIAVTAAIAGDRLVVGLGSGWRAEELDVYGVEPAGRLGQLRRTARTLRRAVRGEPVTSSSGTQVTITPVPSTPVPVWVGGRGPRSLALAADEADGYLAAAGRGSSAASVKTVFDTVRANRAGRPADGTGFTYALYVSTYVSESGDAWSEVAPHHSFTQQQYDRMRAQYSVAGPTADPLPAGERDALRPDVVYGNPQEVIDQLGPFVDALGSDGHLILRAHYPTMDRGAEYRSTELLAERVLPALRAR